MMRKEIEWDKNDICKCQIANFEHECYSDDLYYILEPGGPFKGVGTAIVHAKCGKPIHPDRAFGNGISFPLKWQFYGR